MNFDCPHCKGSGSVALTALTPARQKCLKVMAELGPATHEEIFRAMPRSGNNITSIFQMIKRMESAGLVRRVDSGRPARFVVNTSR